MSSSVEENLITVRHFHDSGKAEKVLGKYYTESSLRKRIRDDQISDGRVSAGFKYKVIAGKIFVIDEE